MINIQIKQNLIPKQVYIGDSAQLLCSFNSNSEILKSLLAEKDIISLPLENFATNLDFTQYDIKEITLAKAGIDYYNLNLSFVPWRTGPVQFPDYRLFTDKIENQEIVIIFEPLSISSLTEEKSITSIKNLFVVSPFFGLTVVSVLKSVLNDDILYVFLIFTIYIIRDYYSMP